MWWVATMSSVHQTAALRLWSRIRFRHLSLFSLCVGRDHCLAYFLLWSDTYPGTTVGPFKSMKEWSWSDGWLMDWFGRYSFHPASLPRQQSRVRVRHLPQWKAFRTFNMLKHLGGTRGYQRVPITTQNRCWRFRTRFLQMWDTNFAEHKFAGSTK